MIRIMNIMVELIQLILSVKARCRRPSLLLSIKSLRPSRPLRPCLPASPTHTHPPPNSYCISVCFRITLNGMKVSRPDVRIGRYRMIKHERDKHNEPNPQRYCISVRSCSPAPCSDRSAPLLSHNYTDDSSQLFHLHWREL